MKKTKFKIGEKVKLTPSMYQSWMEKYGYKRNGIYKIKAIEGIAEDLLVFEKIAWKGRAYDFRFKRYRKKRKK